MDQVVQEFVLIVEVTEPGVVVVKCGVVIAAKNMALVCVLKYCEIAQW